ncbi:hypothetical protein Hanom_Chr16g01467931 [Helianthus anomalus]
MDFRDCFPIQWALYFLIVDIQSHRSKIHCRLGSVEAKIFIKSSRYKSGRSTMKKCDNIDKATVIKIEDFEDESSEDTYLIYVDGTTCKGKEEARSIHPFEFWTFEQLHIRPESCVILLKIIR